MLICRPSRSTGSRIGSPARTRGRLLTPLRLLSILALPVAAHAQSVPVTHIPDKPVCTSCDIQLTELLRLGTDEGPGIVAIPNQLSRDPRGRYLLASGLFMGELKVYNPDGSYLRSLTKGGGGPGENSRGVLVQIMPGDTIYAFDTGSTRVNVFSPELQLVRTMRFALNGVSHALSAGQLVIAEPKVVNGAVTTTHLMTPDGAVARSFGTPKEPIGADKTIFLWRHLAAARNGNGVWSVPRYGGDYRIEKWNLNGQLEKYLVRAAPWFQPKGFAGAEQWRPGVTPPPPSMAAIREDSLGRLWIIAAVARPDWKQFETPGKPTPYTVFDTWLEVIDPDGPAVLLRKRLPFSSAGFVGSDLHSYEEDDAGMPAIRIWRVTLRER